MKKSTNKYEIIYYEKQNEEIGTTKSNFNNVENTKERDNIVNKYEKVGTGTFLTEVLSTEEIISATFLIGNIDKSTTRLILKKLKLEKRKRRTNTSCYFRKYYLRTKIRLKNTRKLIVARFNILSRRVEVLENANSLEMLPNEINNIVKYNYSLYRSSSIEKKN